MKPSVARGALFAVLSALPILSAAPSHAQEPPVAGRYQFQPVEGGLARLDTATGEISICRLDPGRMACDMAPARPAAGAVVVPGRPAAGAAEEDAEFERSLGRLKRVFRTFGDIAREFEQERPPAAPVPDRT